MDFRNLSANQMDNIVQRRPSLSSLSSASGYSSSSTPFNTKSYTPSNLMSKDLQSSWLNQPSSTSIGPWVEQQQQQTLDALDKTTLDKPINDETKPNDNEPHETHDNIDDDELIPTAIVIKNIPFAIKKEQLLEVMTKLNLPLPYAFNYHFDNGVFRGLAFANFTSTDETSLVVNQLNGREIGGRKLRVEYKKMLPAQERERIEREKREKRGQLEEQHRSTSNASLASLLSQASTTAATKNLSVAGTSTSQERIFLNLPFGCSSFSPPELNFNDPEILELYTQLVLYRDDASKTVFELAISPLNLNIAQRKIISYVCNYLNLLELFDNGMIIIRRKPGHISIAPGQTRQQPLHSASMMNLNQLANPPELLRSHSQSAIPMPRLRQQASTPTQQQPQIVYQQRPYTQHGYYQQSQQPPQLAQSLSAGSSAAALLRTNNNRSYVDVRSTPPLNQQESHPMSQQQHQFFQPNPATTTTTTNTNAAATNTNNAPSQPQTPSSGSIWGPRFI
ncbi:PIN4 [Candida margitis]|uniref:PIN4 n=1 Tax=Candida margitis TaxID=1775924 RepID=UPI002226BB2D|nr:PIN4 [Candida margitis]KAI5969567.1 PIN4 [Candida margitis]